MLEGFEELEKPGRCRPHDVKVASLLKLCERKRVVEPLSRHVT